MVDINLDEIAAKELLNEAKRGAARASVYGALGWQKCPLKPTNKIFLQNMLLSAISSNRQKGSDHCVEKAIAKGKHDDGDEAEVGKSNKASEKPAGSSCEKQSNLQKNVLNVISSNRQRGSDHGVEKSIIKTKYDDVEAKVGKSNKVCEKRARSSCEKPSNLQKNVLNVMISSNRQRGSDHSVEKSTTKRKYGGVEAKVTKSNKACKKLAVSSYEKPSNLQKNVLSVIPSNRQRGSDHWVEKSITKRKYDDVEAKVGRSNKASENPPRSSCEKLSNMQKNVLSVLSSNRQRGSDHCVEKSISKRKYDVEAKVGRSNKASENPPRSSCEKPSNMQKNVLGVLSSNRQRGSDHYVEKSFSKRKYDDVEAKVGRSNKVCEKRVRSSCEKSSNSHGSPVPSYFRQSEAGNKTNEKKDVKNDSRGKKDSLHHQNRTSHSNRKFLTRREESLKNNKDYSRTHRKYDKV